MITKYDSVVLGEVRAATQSGRLMRLHCSDYTWLESLIYKRISSQTKDL